MSAVVVGGRAYAAGLYWLGREGARANARTARRLNRPWCVHHGGRTGFAADDPADGPDVPGPAGRPALAAALLEHIDGGFWMALVEGGADPSGGPGGGEGRYALVKARDGTVLADGDEVFDDRGAALAAFERARGLGWTLHATPGLLDDLDGDAAPLDPAALDKTASGMGTAIVLVRAAPSGGRMRVPRTAPIGLAALVVAGGLWLTRDALVAWLAPAAPAPAPAAPAEAEVSVTVDPGALIAACRRALIGNPPFLPGWRIERIECAARFADDELSGLRPELAGRPVLLARWRLAPGHAEAVQRRVAERHLGGWHAATVADGRAWALAPLGPVLRVSETAPPALLDLRRSVDRAFGTGGARIGYARGAGGGWSVRIDDPGPLPRLARLAGGIAGLELTALSRGETGGWRLAGRPAAPVTLPASRLRALGVAVGDAGAGEAPGNGHGSSARKERSDRAAGSGEAPAAAGGQQMEVDDGT